MMATTLGSGLDKDSMHSDQFDELYTTHSLVVCLRAWYKIFDHTGNDETEDKTKYSRAPSVQIKTLPQQP